MWVRSACVTLGWRFSAKCRLATANDTIASHSPNFPAFHSQLPQMKQHSFEIEGLQVIGSLPYIKIIYVQKLK